MSMTMPIPAKLREELNDDEFMHLCGLTGKANPVWHHAFEYAGKRMNERWAIFPLTEEHHERMSSRKSVHNDHTLKEFVQYRCLCRMNREELIYTQKKYSHVNWSKLFASLKEKYAYFDIDRYLFSC